MVDPTEYFTDLACTHPGVCDATISKRGFTWFCRRPKGHEGDHARVDMDVRFFTSQPTSRMKCRSALRDRERGAS